MLNSRILTLPLLVLSLTVGIPVPVVASLWNMRANDAPTLGVQADPSLVGVPLRPISKPGTNWGLFNASMDPVSPQVDDPVMFYVVLRALHSEITYPQYVQITGLLDGSLIAAFTLAYPGPTGLSIALNSTDPWVATKGRHTLIWAVDPVYIYNDVDRSNNEIAFSFNVSEPPSFDLTVSPTAKEVAAGESAAFSVAVSFVTSTPQPVRLTVTGLPSGVAYNFSRFSSNPLVQSTLQIATMKTTSLGTYVILLTASNRGVVRTANLTLKIVAPPQPDFVISVTPSSGETEQGDTATYTVAIGTIGGFESKVDLSVSGLPADAERSFSQTQLTPSGSATLAIRTSRKTPTGTYAMAITASGGGKTHSATVVLTVKQGRPLSFLEILNEYWFIAAGLILALALAATSFVLKNKRTRASKSQLPLTAG